MTENLPDWAFVGAEVVFVATSTGMGADTVTRATIKKITPSGQIVTTASDLRLMPRDYLPSEDRYRRWRSEGRMSFGSIDLYPRTHPKVPKMLAQQAQRNAWHNVALCMRNLEKQHTRLNAHGLRIALEVWEHATANLEDI